MSDNLPMVAYWNNIPTPYVVGRFNAVATRGNITLEAWFNSEREVDRSWIVNPDSWKFRARYIPSIFIGGKQFHAPVAELLELKPQLLVTLPYPMSIVGASVGKVLAPRTAYRVLPTYDSWVKRSRIKEVAKHVLYRAVDGVKVPGPSGAEVALRYGVPQSRIDEVTQSIDVEHFSTARDIASSMRRSEREKRGLHGCVFVYTGRLWSGKGIDTLLHAYELVTQQTRDASLLIIGDGVDQETYIARSRELPHVFFEGFVQPENLPRLYGLGDVFVFPTLGDPHGLVVEEAMAAGLPVISSSAAGDIRRRLPDGEAGFIVPPTDVDTLSQKMILLAQDQELRRRMASTAQDLVLTRSHEHYAIDFEHFVERTLSNPVRVGPAVSCVRAAGKGIIRMLPVRPAAPLISSGS